MPSLTLHYFAFPGRAEPTRLLLTIGGVPFVDHAFPREEWPELKKAMPFGQVPVLEVDGKMLAQSSAIERYAAKLSGLYPTDHWEAAKADEMVAFNTEIWDLFNPTYQLPTLEERIAARQALLSGPIGEKLKKLEALMVAAGDAFLTGPKLTYADILIYAGLANISSGFLDGVPTDFISAGFPGLKKFHAKIAALPAVAAYYKDAGEGPKKAFKALP